MLKVNRRRDKTAAQIIILSKNILSMMVNGYL